MMEGFVASRIRRLNLGMLFFSLAVLGLVLLGLIANTRYLYNMALGPFPLGRAGLIALTSADDLSQYYVTVRGEDHVDTGYAYVSRSDSGRETVEYYYHALFVGDRLLLVKSKSSEIQNEQSGALRDLPPDVQTEVIAELEKEEPSLQGVFLPTMLDATNFYSGGFWGLAIAALIGLLSAWGLLVALRRLVNPQAHPALRALDRFGSLETVTGEIDMEMAQPHQQVGKNIHLTNRWLVNARSSFSAMPYRDIVWCYKSVTQHRYNGIPTGKTYAALVYDRHGRNLSIPGKEREVDEILHSIVRLGPGVVAGYSDELASLWQKDRAGFVRAVSQRRESGS